MDRKGIKKEMNSEDIFNKLSEQTEALRKIAIKAANKTIIQPLIDEGELLRKDLLVSYLKVNYDKIYNCIEQISTNAALSLELIKDRLEQVDIENLFNLNEYMESILSNPADEERYIAKVAQTPEFEKFFLSWIWYVNPVIIITAMVKGEIHSSQEFKERMYVKNYLR